MNILKDHFKQVMVYESAASEGKLPGIQPRCPVPGRSSNGRCGGATKVGMGFSGHPTG